MQVAAPAGVLGISTRANKSHLSRLARAGRAQRLAPGLYVLDAVLPLEAVVRHHRLAIVAHVWPDAVLCGRTALAGGEPIEGRIFLAHPEPARTSPLELPGSLVLVPTIGPPHLPGDMSLPSGLWLSGPARGLVENVHTVGRPAKSRAGTPAVENAIDEMARTAGAGRIQTVLGQLDVISPFFDAAAVELVRSRLAALLGTVSGRNEKLSPRLRARLAGEPFDQHRLTMIASLIEALDDRAPSPRHALPGDPKWTWLAFFEAYFSNYIEGTRFGVDEAKAIAVDGLLPKARPRDAHDVAATYRLTSSQQDTQLVPRSADELIGVLKKRHAILMAARPETRPGDFKNEPNYAGGYRFVDPELVEGTLREGFNLLNSLVDPFARAVAMMLLVTECHPFDDGNGRVARLMSNAELTAAGQVRLVIPAVYRDNYLSGLSGVSNGAGRGESLIAVLGFAQKWTAAMQWETYDGAREEITACNAFLDPSEAESSGRRLLMPTPTS